MGHYFESGVFYGEAAWHTLGKTLKEDDPRRKSVEGTIVASDMDWETMKVAVATSRNADVPEQCRGRLIPDRFAVIRTSDWSYLGTVGSDHQSLQNREMFEWFQPFLDSGECEFETAGSLKEGRVVWILAKICQDDIVVRQGDTVRKYLLLSSSHDGTMATRVGFSPIRTVCWNTLSAAHQIADSKLIRVKHTKSQHEALAAVRDTMDLINKEFKATEEQYRRLAECGLSEAQLAKYACNVLGIDNESKDQVVSTQKKNQLERIVQLAIGGLGQGKTSLTAWDAYNGLTQWLAHERQKDTAKRVTSLWFGDSANMNRKAFDLAVALAS